MGLSSFQLTALDYQRLTDWKARIIAKLAAKYRAFAFFVDEMGHKGPQKSGSGR